MSHSWPIRAPRHPRQTASHAVGNRRSLALAGCILGAVLASSPLCHAQAQPAARPQAAAGVDTSPDALVVVANRVLALLDAGNVVPLWQDMPPELQSRFQRDTFLADMKSTRQSFGALGPRRWSGVGRLRYAAPSTPEGVPAGLYANVEMSSTTADGRPLIERVSFRIENDGSFRFTGYVPRRAAPPNTNTNTNKE